MERVGVEEGQTPGADALSTYLKQEERKLKATVCFGCVFVYACAVCVCVCARKCMHVMCTCVDACARVQLRRWPSIRRRTPPPLHLVSSAWDCNELIPPPSPSLSLSLCCLLLFSPRSAHLIFSRAPPTPPYPTPPTPAFLSSSSPFSISSSLFCSAPVHFLRLPVHHRVTSSSPSLLVSIRLLVTTPCQQCSSVMVCLLFPLCLFFPPLLMIECPKLPAVTREDEVSW